MRKIVLFMHVSLDGFVAGVNGEMNWIHVDEEIFDYAGDRTNQSDTALYGRNTFEMMENYWPTAGDDPDASRHDKQHSAWYNHVHKIVLSKTLSENNFKNTTVINDNIKERINDLKQKQGKEIVIFGSPGAAHSLMKLDLIDDYWLFVNPILLGEGMPLFKNIATIKKLDLKKVHSFTSGVVCLHYENISR
jgi:dihydrofolate reductase